MFFNENSVGEKPQIQLLASDVMSAAAGVYCQQMYMTLSHCCWVKLFWIQDIEFNSPENFVLASHYERWGSTWTHHFLSK